MSEQNLRQAQDERDDVLAYLVRKRRNAETMKARSADFADQATWMIQQINVIEQDLRTGLHIGEAGLAAAQAEGGA